MTLGERIKEHRIKLSLTQEKVAELVGTSRQAVTKWESDQSIPCMENLITLADILNITLNELLHGTSGNEPSGNADIIAEQPKHRKIPVYMDVVFAIVAVFTMWSIIRIPAFIGFSVVGFLTIVAQTVAVLYIPLYLFLIRPRRIKSGVIAQNAAMSKDALKNRIFWALGAVVTLAAGYILCGHVFLFLHGMGQWPIILSVFGLIVISIAAVTDSRKVMFCVGGGYVIGFVLGMSLNWDTFHPDRGPDGLYTNNAWELWTVSYLIIIAAGIVWEIIARKKKKREAA